MKALPLTLGPQSRTVRLIRSTTATFLVHGHTGILGVSGELKPEVSMHASELPDQGSCCTRRMQLTLGHQSCC